MFLQEEVHHLPDQSANINQDEAANNHETRATNLQEKTEHLKKKPKWQNWWQKQSLWRKDRVLNSNHKDWKLLRKLPNQRHATNSYKVEESQWKCRYSFNLYNIPCKKEEINCGKRVCQGHNPKRSGNADRGEVIYNGSYTDYETELHQSLNEKIVSADVKSVRKVERRSVDRDANMGLEKIETWVTLQAQPENHQTFFVSFSKSKLHQK